MRTLGLNNDVAKHYSMCEQAYVNKRVAKLFCVKASDTTCDLIFARVPLATCGL